MLSRGTEPLHKHKAKYRVGCKNYISQIKMLIYSKQNKYNYADFEQYDKRISTQEAGILFIACETELMQIAKVQK
jgi:hypothetical protein